MPITAPEMVAEKPQVKPTNESRADGRRTAENNGSAELGSGARRGKRRRSTRGSGSPSSVQRFFLTRDGGSNGIPQLDHEVEDENTAMVEALKTGSTFIMLSEWRPTVDNTTKGRPVITKEAVSKAR